MCCIKEECFDIISYNVVKGECGEEKAYNAHICIYKGVQGRVTEQSKQFYAVTCIKINSRRV